MSKNPNRTEKIKKEDVGRKKRRENRKNNMFVMDKRAEHEQINLLYATRTHRQESRSNEQKNIIQKTSKKLEIEIRRDFDR